MIADIIPTQKMPRNLSSLTYRVPPDLRKKIKVGQIVKIPLRHKIIEGAVLAIKKKADRPYRLKGIKEIVQLAPIFTGQQLSFFDELAKNNFVSTSLLVHFNLPRFIKKEREKLGYQQINSDNKPTAKTKTLYLWWTNKKERNKYYRQRIKANLTCRKQILIIVPRIKDIYQLADELGLRKSDFTAVHRQLKRAENARLWQQALSGEKLLFIGTRSALFYPYTRLGEIIIDEENSNDHKQYDMNPRYDARTAAQLMQKFYHQRLTYSSYAPSVKLYYKYRPATPETKQKPNIKIINIEHLLASKNYTFISDSLLKELKKLNGKEKAFIFINHKGEARLTKCADCGYIFKCPHCQLPLIKQDNRLVCYYCQHQEDLPPFCPQCQGAHLKSSGLGVQKISRQIKEILPQLKTKTLDKENSGQKTDQDNNWRAIIGTEFVLDKINWKEIKVIGIINADQLWQHAEFMAAERAYQLLTKILTLAPQKAKIIFQTFSPQHKIIQAITQNKPLIFYRAELKIRRDFGYPPYNEIIKISCLNKSKQKAYRQAEKIYQRLRNEFKRKVEYEKIFVSAPLPILRQKIRGKYKFNLIVKTQVTDSKKWLEIIPADCLIDIEPVKLLD